MTDVDVYPVGLLSDFKQRRGLKPGLRYLRYQAEHRNWRAVRNYFNGYLCEHGFPHHHHAGRGWTRRAARRRAARLCKRAGQDL